MSATGGHAAACAICKLSPKKLARLHQEHRDGVDVEALIETYSLPEHRLRKAELRRHLAAHLQFVKTASGQLGIISERDGSPKLNDYAGLAQYLPEPEGALEAAIKGTLRELARCEEQGRAASARRDSTRADRELAKSIKLKRVLIGQVRELEAVREPRRVLSRFIFKGFEEAERLTKLRVPEFAKEQRDQIDRTMDEFLRTLQVKALKSGLATVEYNLTVGLRKFVKDLFLDVSGWVEKQVAEMIGSKYIPKEKHAWEE